MRQGTLEDTALLLEVIGDNLPMINGLREKLVHGLSVLLISDDETAVACYDFIAPGKWLNHMMSKPEGRGRDLWHFALDTALWMIENREMAYMLTLVDTRLKAVYSFWRRYGLPPVAKMGPEELYITSADKIKEISLVGIRL